MISEDEEAKQLVKQLEIIYALRVEEAKKPPKPFPKIDWGWLHKEQPTKEAV